MRYLGIVFQELEVIRVELFQGRRLIGACDGGEYVRDSSLD